MNKIISKEQREQLRVPLPNEAVSQHPTKKFLSSIKAIYVVERLNDVFGVGEWKVKNEVISADGKWVIVKSVFTVNGYDIEVEQFGGNDNADPGDAFKGAATDALTKIGSYLEIGIDVFKGKQNTPEQPKKDEDNRPWLSDALFKKILDALKEKNAEDKKEAKDSTFKAYRIKKDYKEQLDKA